jgi:23S rRNA (guanosine2251-2'-O)-methyltransferase
LIDFGRPNEEIAKTSLGATESVSWEYCAETKLCLERLRREGVTIVAVEQHARAIPYTEAVYGGDVAYIFGNEIEGVPNDICKEADSVVHIPMHGMKESLNVSVSAGIILFEARKKQ